MATSVCAECHKNLIAKMNDLVQDLDRLQDLMAQYEIKLSMLAEARAFAS
jgi:hypothetical protein